MAKKMKNKEDNNKVRHNIDMEYIYIMCGYLKKKL